MVEHSYCIMKILGFLSNLPLFLCQNEKPSSKYDWSAKSKDALNGVHVRISFYYINPLFTGYRLPNGSYVALPSVISEVIENMAQHFNMTYEYRIVDPNKWAHEGTYATIMGQLLNDETDIAPLPTPRTVQFSKQSFMGVSFFIQPYIFLQPFPLEDSRITAPIRPFDGLVWGIFLFSTFAFMISMTLLSLRKAHKSDLKASFITNGYRSFQYVMTIVLAQGNSSPASPAFSLRVMVGLWLLMMVIVINAYTGTLSSFLTVPKFEPTIDTLEQLVANKKKLTTEKKGQLEEMFLNATSGINKIIGDDLRKNPDLLFSGYAILTRNIVERGYIYCGPELSARGVAVLKFRDAKKCVVILSKKPLQLSADAAFPMRKEWTYNKVVDQNYMQYLWESGLTSYLLNKYVPRIAKCSIHQERGRQEPFKLNDFRSIFLLMTIGLVFSFITFLVELLVNRLRPFVSR